MRYAIISDIHGNLEALQAVLNECRRLKAQTVVCLGDILGYGANPKECLDLIRKLNILTVAGNHDWAVSGRLDFSHFTPDGQAAVLWTRSQISMQDISYLNSLPLCLKSKDCILVHGSLKNPEQFIYLTSPSKAQDAFALMEASVLLVGHTHVPKIFIQRPQGIIESEQRDVEIDSQYKYIVNAGSVGQPRDGNPLASFCIYDTSLGLIENHRVLYDVKKAQQKIIQAGLPNKLALRLTQGE